MWETLSIVVLLLSKKISIDFQEDEEETVPVPEVEGKEVGPFVEDGALLPVQGGGVGAADWLSGIGFTSY